MDFGRSIKKRAKQIDNKLDQIVPNPYEGQVKEHYNKVKKPLLISLGAAAACACFTFGCIGVVQILKYNNANKGRVTFDPDFRPQPKPDTDPDKTKPYIGKTPKVDLKNYVSTNFGFPEFSYFSFFANNITQTKMMAPMGNIIDNEEQEFTTMNPMDSYLDDDGRIHYPLPICETYSFSDFLYFEFTANNDPFLEGKIGSGRIQALSVHTSVYDEDILILKNGSKFYSCLLNGKSNDSLGKVTELGFSAHKYIEGWDIVKDDNELPLTIYFKTGKGYEGAAAMEINHKSYDIDSTSVFYLNYSFRISVNQVRRFIGLDPDPRFNGNQINLETKEMNYNKQESFVLEEFGDTPFVYSGETSNRIPMFKLGDRVIELSNYYVGNNGKFYVTDVNDDGYRDFVYLYRIYNSHSIYEVSVYDVHNDRLMSENITHRATELGLLIHENKLVVYQCFFPGTDREMVYDYADIVCNKSDTSSIVLKWRNIYQIEKFEFDHFEDLDGNIVDYDYEENGCYYYTIPQGTRVNAVLTIERSSGNLDIPNFTPEKAGCEMYFYELTHSAQYEDYIKTGENTYSIEILFGEGTNDFVFELSSFESIRLNVKVQ